MNENHGELGVYLLDVLRDFSALEMKCNSYYYDHRVFVAIHNNFGKLYFCFFQRNGN